MAEQGSKTETTITIIADGFITKAADVQKKEQAK